ncbi:MFS transporter [Cytobacillus depressus]|uniref:Putative tartrate transporter n=1 Tax=Cytobacillus depressus TaxID=1602942 RepID=A0A6L3UZB8_9BACI|nr:MFS transporter [Cytobacillus depressus]KAB2328316.1 MFS transporter [Cytobacillus depressus]
MQKSELEERTLKKVSRRIIPYIFVLYIIAFLDRVNIGYAALDMNKALGLTATAMGLISGIFFISYFLFEVPSNMLMHRIGARKWIGRIMISWGIVVIITAWVQNANHLYILRFILGVAEAGFFPGVILYITYWFRGKERARAVALFMAALPVSNIIGAPLSTWIMDNINWAGMEGWRWMFILEGIPAVILGIVTIFYLTDRPDQAKWLTKEEKEWLISELENENKRKTSNNNHKLKDIFASTRVWRLSFIYLTLVTGLYGIGFWMPTIIKGFSDILSNSQVGLIAMIPYILGGIGMVLWARNSDRTGERKMHAALPPLIGAIGLFGCGLTTNPVVSIVMMSIVTVGIYSIFGPFWAIPSLFLSEYEAAVGIALISSIGNLGGFIGPYVIGYVKDATGSVEMGLYFLSLVLFICFLLVFTIKKEHVTSPSITLQANKLNIK